VAIFPKWKNIHILTCFKFISISQTKQGRLTDNNLDSGLCAVLYAANLARFPLRRLLYQLEKIAGNAKKAEAIKAKWHGWQYQAI